MLKLLTFNDSPILSAVNRMMLLFTSSSKKFLEGLFPFIVLFLKGCKESIKKNYLVNSLAIFTQTL